MKWGRSRQVDGVPAPVDPDELEHAVGEALLIARQAAIVAITNRIIVRALHEGAVFDRDHTEALVREELGRLADEQRTTARRMSSERRKAGRARGRSKHQHDYRRDDDFALWFRENTYTTVADRLLALQDDSDWVDDIVAIAVDRAWGDVGAAVVTRVRSAVVVEDDDYAEHRDERLRGLIDDDLEALRRRPGTT
ncbi:hypothetical protein ACPEEZ_12520 [Frigoribacterium sp. 2-23]|uniref:hypothetical protein n=1 Tax=Frigoribacterium sp. 2-23 TaxID=3415006 RepID=UPI003C6EADAB